MIKKLRQKFVIVTMLLMTVTFGGFLLVNHLSASYWDEQEMLHTLEWYAQSGSFFEFDTSEISLLEEYGRTIFAIRLDKNLEILEIQSSSKTSRNAPSAQEIAAIFRQSPDSHKWKSYLYIISEEADGHLLIITNMSDGTGGLPRVLGNALLICLGFFALLFVSLLLSGFVTLPAKQALEREKQFISDASHELKTPLAAISINAQALQTELDNNRHLTNILSETRRMDALIQKLLKLSYLEEVGYRIEKTLFSLSHCCEEMALSMESVIYEHKIVFQYDIEPDIDYCGNEDDIKQVLAILLDNAIKHTPEHGTILFTLKQNGSAPTITVENSGPAIPPEDLPHIFERFYRTDRSRNNSTGYGLGLAIAKAILDSHNASICAANGLAEGVRFTISM